MKLLLICLIATAVVSMASVSMAEEKKTNFSIYHIGNSLSQDMYYCFHHLGENYEASLGNTYSWGYHFRSATSLTYIFLHPDDHKRMETALDLPKAQGDENKYAYPWPKALKMAHWDAVTLQPHPGGDDLGPATLETDTKAIFGMIAQTQKNPANKNTRFFIYQAWMGVSPEDPMKFANAYTADTIDKKKLEDTPSSAARDYIGLLCDTVRKKYPNVSVIPVGEVLFAIDEKMRAGEFEQFKTMSDLHRDVIHMNSVGQNIAAWTTFAVVFQKSPVGLEYVLKGNSLQPNYTNGPETINAHDLKLMQETVWEVVQKAKKYTNVP